MPSLGCLMPRVREMLEAVAEVERAFRAEAVADAQVVAELERGAEALVAERGLATAGAPRSRLSTYRPAQVVLLQAEHRRQPDLGDVVVLARAATSSRFQ